MKSKAELLYFGDAVPPVVRDRIPEPLIHIVKLAMELSVSWAGAGYMPFIERTEYDAYLIPRWWAEHDYGPIPGSGATVVRERVRPLGKIYIAGPWDVSAEEEQNESAWTRRWQTVTTLAKSFSRVALPLNVPYFSNTEIGRRSLHGFVEALKEEGEALGIKL